MFGKWMNNYYYGKSGKGDYRPDDLPKTRWQLFWEMLRVRFAALFRLNLTGVVVWVPAVLVISRLVSGLYNIMLTTAEAQRDPTAATAEMLQISGNSAQLMNDVLFISLLTLIPALFITGPISAGWAYVTRNWARDEHAFVWSDFKDAVKANWKQALGVSAITSILPFVVYVSYRFYGSMLVKSPLFVVPQMLVMVMGAVWALMLVYLYPMLVTYNMPFKTLLKNSLLLAIGRLPQTIGVRLAALVPAIIVGLVSYLTPYGLYALMVLALYYFLMGHCLSRFIFAAFSNAVFDRYINSRIAGAEVGRGLREDEDDDDGDDDDSEAQA